MSVGAAAFPLTIIIRTPPPEVDRLHFLFNLIRRHSAQVSIDCNGSASEGTTSGDAAAPFTHGDHSAPHHERVIQRRGRPQTSSFEDKQAAMQAAFSALTHNSPASALICTDGQSLLLNPASRLHTAPSRRSPVPPPSFGFLGTPASQEVK